VSRRVAVVESDGLVRRSLVGGLSPTRCVVEEFGTGRSFLRGLSDDGSAGLALVLMSFRLPDVDALRLLRRVRVDHPGLPVVMLAGFGDLGMVDDATQLGAAEVLQTPVSAELLQSVFLRHANPDDGERETMQLEDDQGLQVGSVSLIGRSERMRRLLSNLRRVAGSDIRAILIRGETGTGKELVANLLHELSPRRAKAFVPLNSGAVMPSLLESEMFGYEKGAFTGAQPGGQRGRIEYADGGTVFLDEIGDMDPALQVKLLRTLETGEIRRVGSNELRHVDVRFVAATHQDMRRLVREGRFRRDLYHRLSVVLLKVPPLRKRGDDILLLAEHFLDHFAQDMEREPPKLSVGARVWLTHHQWPGNVRELRNMMERVALMSRGAVLAEDLSTMEGGMDSLSGDEMSIVTELPSVTATATIMPDDDALAPAAPGVIQLDGMTLDAVERAAIERAMARANNNVAEAARLLGLGYGAMRHRLAKINEDRG
jgi:DNA-binding NtrC family response regulator